MARVQTPTLLHLDLRLAVLWEAHHTQIRRAWSSSSIFPPQYSLQSGVVVGVGAGGLGVAVGTGVEGWVWALGVGLPAPMIVPISSPNMSMIALVSCGYCIRQGMTTPTCWGVTSCSPLIKALYCSLPKAV